MALTAPTPPTPPTIDKGDVQSSTPRIDAHQFFEVPEMPFHSGNGKTETVDETSKIDNQTIADEKVSVDEKPASTATREVTTPEDMARDAVANGSGALTRRTVTRVDDSDGSTNSNQNVNSNSNANQNSNPTPNTNTNSNSNSNSNVVNVPAPQMPPSTNSESYERGQAVLREFRDEDKRLEETSTENSASTSTPANFHNSEQYQESHGGIFWILTLIFVVAATFLVAKRFLFRSKPALKKSDLFMNSSEKLKSTAEKFSTPPKTSTPSKKFAPKVEPAKSAEKVPPVKPVQLPKKDDDDKGKHFEIRV